jgi:hypothetical protein
MELGMSTTCEHVTLVSTEGPGKTAWAQGLAQHNICTALHRPHTFWYLMILLMKLRGYSKSATMGILTRRVRTLGYNLMRLSTMAWSKREQLSTPTFVSYCPALARLPW